MSGMFWAGVSTCGFRPLLEDVLDCLVDQGNDVGVDHPVADASAVSLRVDPTGQAKLGEVLAEKVIVLLGYQEATAGGLMGVDYLSVPTTSTAAEVLRAAGQATQMRPEALVALYCHDEFGRLCGVVALVALLQSDPQDTMQVLADPEPVHVHPDADLTEITQAMADDNLLVLPVLDRDDHLIGVVTIDDVIEASIGTEQRRMHGQGRGQQAELTCPAPVIFATLLRP